MKQLTSASLKEAIKLVRKGWIKREMRQKLNGHYGYCALGSVMQARINVGEIKTFRRLPTSFNERLTELYEEYKDNLNPYRGCSVVSFNDHDATKKEDVINFLRFAADEQEKEERKRSNSV